MVNTEDTDKRQSDGSLERSSPDQLVEWDEETGEYEVDTDVSVRPIRFAQQDLTDMATDKGFEFETADEVTEGEKDELDARHNYWTREQMMSYLEVSPKPVEDLCEQPDLYDERIKCMEPLVKDGVYKKLVRRGAGDVVTVDSAVLYNLNAFLEGTDEPFDSTWLRGRPNLHRLSYDTILPGICAALMSMRRGERSEFMVRPHMAYLEMGCPPRIPENATILYIIEVIKVYEEGTLAHLETLSFEERANIPFPEILALCDTERKSASGFFVDKRYREAAFRYRRAIRCLEGMTWKSMADKDKADELLLKLYVNIANTYNKFQKPFNAMSNCKKALAIDAKSVKALYQYGLAKMANADYSDAERYLKQALHLKPNNREIKEALVRLDQRMNGERKLKDELYRRMGSMFDKK